MKTRTLPAYCISGRPLEEVGGVVVHYFSGKNVDQENQFDLDVCYGLFKDLNRPKAQREQFMQETKWPDGRMYASAHVLVGRDGEVWKLVEFNRQAYHAGTSVLDGRSNCNRWTLGVELVGGIGTGFTTAQYEALADFLVEMVAEHGFSRDCIAGHDTVRDAAIQSGSLVKRKFDPSGRPDGFGDNFDWGYLWDLMDRKSPDLSHEARATPLT